LTRPANFRWLALSAVGQAFEPDIACRRTELIPFRGPNGMNSVLRASCARLSSLTCTIVVSLERLTYSGAKWAQTQSHERWPESTSDMTLKSPTDKNPGLAADRRPRVNACLTCQRPRTAAWTYHMATLQASYRLMPIRSYLYTNFNKRIGPVLIARTVVAFVSPSKLGTNSARHSSHVREICLICQGGIAMKRTIALLAAIAIFAVGSTVYALYEVSDQGTWPKSWPKELESLRKQARTLVGPEAPFEHYQIPFTKREEFESAWLHFLKVKSKGAPIILVRGPKTDFMEIKPAGVLIHSPPPGQNKNPATPEAPIAGVTNVRERWMYTTFIELVVDGNIVDLNRLPLPPDTPIIDERFKDAKTK
jgi:hypothetical protein